jgi:hypothetical protein
MITNERVCERVMRMGIEHRAGVPLDKLWDLARQQLKAAKAAPVKSSITFNEWLAQEFRFAFTHIQGVLTVIKVPDVSKIEFKGWRTPTIPLVSVK